MFLLEQLNLADFRNCESGEFHFSGEKVVFTGPNGTGKTNLLESIYFLSILRSFRNRQPRFRIVGPGAFARLSRDAEGHPARKPA